MPQELPQSLKHKRAMEMSPKERGELSPVKARHNLNTLDKANNKTLVTIQAKQNKYTE